MTTIAFDGVTLAADGQVSGSYVHPDSLNKIIKLPNGWHVTGSGSLSALTAAWSALAGSSDWALNHYCDDWPDISGECDVLAVSPDGVAVLFDSGGNGFGLSFAPPLALGSGDHAAMAVMLHGGSAVEAIHIAIQLDEGSGGEVTSVDVKGNK